MAFVVRRDKGRTRRQGGGLVLVQGGVWLPPRTCPHILHWGSQIPHKKNVARGKESKMGYDPAKYHRRSLRLKDYDYSQPGLYFITICCSQRQPLFDVPEVHQLVMETWQHLPNRFPTVTLDLFVVMPDHVHGILQLHRPPRQTKAPRLDEIVRVYKSITSVQWLQLNKRRGTICDRHLWQERFYDHVIRNDMDAHRIREYILNNPLVPQLLQGTDIDEQMWEDIITHSLLGGSIDASP